MSQFAYGGESRTIRSIAPVVRASIVERASCWTKYSPGKSWLRRCGRRAAKADRKAPTSLGGVERNRTAVRGFAGRCMTTLPPRRALTPALSHAMGKGAEPSPRPSLTSARGRRKNPGAGPGSSSQSWSGKRGSNSRPQPWQGCALPTELFPRSHRHLSNARAGRFETGRHCKGHPGGVKEYKEFNHLRSIQARPRADTGPLTTASERPRSP